MKTRYFGKLALMLAGCLMFAGTARASIEAFSNLLIENAAVYNFSGGTVGSHTQLTDLVEITVVAAAHSSSADVDIASIAGTSNTSNGPTLTSLGLNSGQAAQGGAPGAGTFNNLPGAGDPHAYAETSGSGSLVAPNGGVVPAFDASLVQTSTVASVNLRDNIGSTDAGQAGATNGVTAAFVVTNDGAALDVLLEFDAFVEQFIDLAPAPPGVAASVDNSWSFSVTDPITGTVIFSWAPNGVPGGITPGATEISDPFDINGGPSGFPGITTGPIMNATPGFTGIDNGKGGAAGLGVGSDPFRASFTLPTGQFSLVVQHSSDAQALTLGIPEPTSIVAWGLLSVCASAACSRRRRGKEA